MCWDVYDVAEAGFPSMSFHIRASSGHIEVFMYISNGVVLSQKDQSKL